MFSGGDISNALPMLGLCFCQVVVLSCVLRRACGMWLCSSSSSCKWRWIPSIPLMYVPNSSPSKDARRGRCGWYLCVGLSLGSPLTWRGKGWRIHTDDLLHFGPGHVLEVLIGSADDLAVLVADVEEVLWTLIFAEGRGNVDLPEGKKSSWHRKLKAKRERGWASVGRMYGPYQLGTTVRLPCS